MRARLLSIASPLVVLAALAVVVAGCGSNDNSSTSAGTGAAAASSAGGAYGGSAAQQQSTMPATTPAGGATVRTARTPLGTILVDSSGRTLYMWEADRTSRSTCSGACAEGWPPLTASGRAMAAGGAQTSQLGTSRRADGTTQVTYAGHPLYTYAGDRAPGDTTGQDSSAFGADWYVVSPSGNKVESEDDDS